MQECKYKLLGKVFRTEYFASSSPPLLGPVFFVRSLNFTRKEKYNI